MATYADLENTFCDQSPNKSDGSEVCVFIQMDVLVNFRHFRYEPYISELRDLPSLGEDLNSWSYLLRQRF